jgi:hypothetical protein
MRQVAGADGRRPGAALPRARTLRPCASYRCRHTGACCRSNWPIPVDAAQMQVYARALGDGRLIRPEATSRSAAPAPVLLAAVVAPGIAVLARLAGACTFHDSVRSRCAVHSSPGDAAPPISCRHFPRICRIGDDRVDVTFSHSCPTVATLLVEHATHAAGRAGSGGASTTPPMLRPARLMDRASYDAPGAPGLSRAPGG